MPKIWRRIVPVAVAGGLVAAAGAIPAEAASTSTSVSINATSPNYPFGTVNHKVDGYALVLYNAPKGWNTATISGKVSGGTSGETAALLAEPFNATRFSTTATAAVKGASTSYTFKVKPTLATKYEVEVLSGSTVKATSNVAAVYVTETPSASKWTTKCSGGNCTFSFKYYQELPASAYKTETAKPWFFYFDLDPKLSPTSFPKYLYLDKSASVSKPHKLSSIEYYVTVTWSYKTTLKNPANYGIADMCTKDSESRDGLGLPGSHGCGAKRVSTSADYVG